MRIKQLIGIFLNLTLCLAGFSGIVAAAAAPKPGSPPIVIPFELVNRHILIKVRINNSAPLSFIFDTGDKFAIVNLARAKALGLNLTNSIDIGGAGSSTVKGSMIGGASLTVAGLDGDTEPVVLAFPLENIASRMGQDVDGIIGTDFMKKFVVEIDYAAQVLRLHAKDGFTYSGPGNSIPATSNAAGYVLVAGEAEVDGHTPIKGNFVLDIGSGGSLVLHRPLVETEHLLPPEQKTIPLIGGTGAGGKVTGRLGRITALTLGKFRLEQPLVLFSSDRAGALASAETLGNIGQQILSKFTVFLDFGHNRIILEPNASLPNPIAPAGSGMNVVAEGSDYKTFRVDEVLANSPANDAGLQKDDIILTADDRAAAGLTLSDLNRLFEHPEPHKISVRRGANTLQMTLTPRRMI